MFDLSACPSTYTEVEEIDLSSLEDIHSEKRLGIIDATSLQLLVHQVAETMYI